jgi:hypothetical protein
MREAVGHLSFSHTKVITLIFPSAENGCGFVV